MPVLALSLLLSSAFLHAFWNLILKQSEQKFLVMGWQVILGGLLAFVALLFTGLPPRSMWLLVLASAVLEVIYFIILTYAYTDNDFSLVYPMARGAAPALVAVWAAFFLSELPTAAGTLGIILVVIGLAIIGVTSLLNHHNPKLQLRGIALALSVALVISFYTLIDGFAVKNGPALEYGLVLFFLMPLMMTPIILHKYGWPTMLTAIQAHPSRILLAGVLGLMAYLSALFAYSIAPVNYSEAIREVSVVIGAFMGWHFLGEKMGKIRLVGAVIIFAGILVIAVFG